MKLLGVRPEYIEGLDYDLWQLIEQCWAHVPEDRPEAGFIANFFENHRKTAST